MNCTFYLEKYFLSFQVFLSGIVFPKTLSAILDSVIFYYVNLNLKEA